MFAQGGRMGLFDLFQSEETKIKKHIRRLTNRDAQPEDRDASARWLADNGTPTALLGLLARFDMALEHQMKDAAEKERHYALCASIGAPMNEPLRSWLRQCRRFGTPLRLYEELNGRKVAIDMALEVLGIELRKDDPAKPEKKRELLVWLADVRDPRVIDAVKPFLADFDETVRFAASEAIINQEDDRGRDLLVDVLANPDEDSNRLRARLAEVFAARRWSLGAASEALAARVPRGYAVRDGRLVST